MSITPIDLAKSLRWQDPSKFEVSILPTGSKASQLLGNITPENLTASVKGINLADMNVTPVEEWIAEEWRFTTGRLEHYQVQINLKDYENFSLYRLFTNALQNFVRTYPDDQKFDILIRTATDFDITTFKEVIRFKDCILISISGASLDNSSYASVAEFSVTAKASYVETYL